MNKWLNHVKMYAKENNMKYNEALKNANCKAEYRKKYGGGLVGNLLKGVANFAVDKAANYVPLPDMIKNPVKDVVLNVANKGIEKTGLGLGVLEKPGRLIGKGMRKYKKKGGAMVPAGY